MRSEFEDHGWTHDSADETVPLPTGEPFRAWDYRLDVGWSPDHDLGGYHVEAADGSVGKVSQSAYATDGSYLLVTTGPWIFGRTIVIPGGIVTNIDHVNRRIYLDRAKDEIKSAPDYTDEPAYWDKVAAYYGQR